LPGPHTPLNYWPLVLYSLTHNLQRESSVNTSEDSDSLGPIDGVEDGRGVPARVRADLPKCSIRAGRQRTLRRKGRWLASPSGGLDTQGPTDEDQRQASDDLRGILRQGFSVDQIYRTRGRGGIHLHCLESIRRGHLHCLHLTRGHETSEEKPFWPQAA